MKVSFSLSGCLFNGLGVVFGFFSFGVGGGLSVKTENMIKSDC